MNKTKSILIGLSFVLAVGIFADGRVYNFGGSGGGGTTDTVARAGLANVTAQLAGKADQSALDAVINSNATQAELDAVEAKIPTGKILTNVVREVDRSLTLTFTDSTTATVAAIPLPPSSVVDTSLSATSTNPVENKVVNSALSLKADKTELHPQETKASIETLGISYTSLSDKPAVETKDSIPTATSTNAVESQGLLTEFNKKQNITDLVTTIRDSASAEDTKYVSEKAIRTLFDSLSITGVYKGSSATLAGLPTGANGDWAILNTLDGANKAGIYVTDGTTYTLAKEIQSFVALTQLQAEDKTSTEIGLVSGERLYQAVQKHGSPFDRFFDSFALANAETILPRQTFTIGKQSMGNFGGRYENITDNPLPFVVGSAGIEKIPAGNYDHGNVTTYDFNVPFSSYEENYIELSGSLSNAPMGAIDGVIGYTKQSKTVNGTIVQELIVYESALLGDNTHWQRIVKNNDYTNAKWVKVGDIYLPYQAIVDAPDSTNAGATVTDTQIASRSVGRMLASVNNTVAGTAPYAYHMVNGNTFKVLWAVPKTATPKSVLFIIRFQDEGTNTIAGRGYKFDTSTGKVTLNNVMDIFPVPSNETVLPVGYQLKDDGETWLLVATFGHDVARKAVIQTHGSDSLITGKHEYALKIIDESPIVINEFGNFTFINDSAVMYSNNTWSQRTVPGFGKGVNFAPPDANHHYRVLKDGLYAINLTLDDVEGGGMTNGVAIQYYNFSGGWYNMSVKEQTPGGSGRRLLQANATLYLKVGDYIRMMVRTTDGGANSYPRNRNYRFSVIQLY